jgi:cell division protein FtsQ
LPAKRKKRRRRRGGGIIVLFLLSIAAVAVTLATPVFNIKEVKVAGNEKLDAGDIKIASGISENYNIFRISTSRAEKSIKKISYISTVKVQRKLPDKVVIEIEEAKICGYIKHSKGMIGLDKTGKVIEVLPADTKAGKYLIKGGTVKEFEVGKKISIDESRITDIILLYINAFEEYGISGNLSEIFVTSPVDTGFITKNGLVVKLGNADELDYKLKYYKRLLTEIGEGESGILDLTLTDKVTFRKN